MAIITDKDMREIQEVVEYFNTTNTEQEKKELDKSLDSLKDEIFRFESWLYGAEYANKKREYKETT